jgi:uncharacterized protein (TIGR02646 family)
MNRINKPDNSRVLKEGMTYENNKKLLIEVLKKEQNYVCAYTQAKFIATLADDVEHFNPYLKGEDNDNYQNWFAVSHKWNLMKGTKNAKARWDEFQPVLHPTAEDFEERINYNDGVYECKDNDVDAKHLIEYLNLNQENLVNDRKNHINGLKFIFEQCGNNLGELVNYLNNIDPNQKQYLRAIETEFLIKFRDDDTFIGIRI